MTHEAQKRGSSTIVTIQPLQKLFPVIAVTVYLSVSFTTELVPTVLVMFSQSIRAHDKLLSVVLTYL